MIYRFPKERYNEIKPLFEEVFFNLNSLATLNGDNPGTVWVDNLIQPKTGIIVDSQYSIYIAGFQHNIEFNKEIVELIKKDILPKAKNHADNGEWLIYYGDESWYDTIEDSFSFEDPLRLKRCYYILSKLKIEDWRSQLPKGYSVERIDRNFLENKRRQNYYEINNYILETWVSVEDFLDRGFGFCVVDEKSDIISWGIADWLTEDKAEMGVGTDENYRKQGFATLVTAATVEYCVKRGLRLGWHCSEHNTGSYKTAEKVGFIKERDYTAAIWNFDYVQNCIENSWYRGFYLEKPEEGIYFAQKGLKADQKNLDLNSILAGLLMNIQQYDEALDTFLKIVKIGPKNPQTMYDNLQQNNIFNDLRSRDTFKMIIKKLEELLVR